MWTHRIGKCLRDLTLGDCVKIAIILCIAAAAITLLILMFVPGSPLEGALADFIEWMDDIPTIYGALLLTGIQGAAVMLILPGTPFNMAAGFLFGVWIGSAVSVISTDIACVLAFFIGRYLAREWAEKQIAKSPKFKALDAAVDQQAMYIITLVRLSPIFPFGLCNYFFGLTNVSFWKYWLASTLGLAPYTIAYTYLGTLVREIADIFAGTAQDSTQQIILLVVGGVATLLTVVVVGYITRRALKNAVNFEETQDVLNDEKTSASSYGAINDEEAGSDVDEESRHKVSFGYKEEDEEEDLIELGQKSFLLGGGRR